MTSDLLEKSVLSQLFTLKFVVSVVVNAFVIRKCVTLIISYILTIMAASFT